VGRSEERPDHRVACDAVGKASRTKRRASVSAARRNRGVMGWYVLSGVVIVAGVIAIIASRSGPAAPVVNEDHWHAAFGVNVCGEWLPDAPAFETAFDNPNQRAGIHSHANGLIHIHPFVSDEAGDNATVGKFLDYQGWTADEDSFDLWDNEDHKTGDSCGEQEGTVRWELNGEPRDDNISDYQPEDGDVIALVLLPEDQEIGEPPAVANLQSPEETTGVSSPTTAVPTDSTVAPTETTAAVPGDTTATSAP
jgi:hypothetical protein